MKYGYTIVNVESVGDTLNFYREAFGFETRFLHEAGDYGELSTGETTLAFASHAMGEMNLGGNYVRCDTSEKPFGVELVFVADDVNAAYAKAVAAGATPIKPPEHKPWGQLVGYVRSKEGSLIELCSAMGG
ncbi:MAG: VOC family protein [Sideroxydans sp.]|nr:VOC family protein [Sideroxydans sp.]